MKHFSIKIIFILLATLIQSCGVDVGGSEDRSNPSVTITAIIDADNTDGQIVGTATIRWKTNEANKSTVDIYFSSDSGLTFNTVIELNAPDTGKFIWDTNSVDDCTTCRIRIVPTDVVGNVGAPSDLAVDFVINNIPNLINNALFYDNDNDGISDGDRIVVQFDKDVIALTANVYDLFVLPVQGDFIGPSPFINTTSDFSKLELVINGASAGNLHLHINGVFSEEQVLITSPSGLSLREDIAGSIVAPDTGRSARPLSSIDISPAFSKQNPVMSQGTNLTQAIALADFDNNGELDLVSVDVADTDPINNGSSVWKNTGNGTFGVGGSGIGPVTTLSRNNDNATSIAVGDIDNDGDIDFILGLSNNAANQVKCNQYVETVGLSLFDFQGPNLTSDKHSTDAVALGDVDNDGDLDLVTGNTDFANLVWIHSGSCSFSHNSGQPGHVLGSSVTRAIKLADIDNDTDLDIIAGNDGSPDKVWINSGINSGVFTDSGQLLGNAATFSITTGDVDNDGDVDYVAGINDGANQLWLNNGSGIFVQSNQSLGQTNTNQTRALLLVDLDNDNDLDLIVGDEDQPNRVWFNDGNGVFQDTGQAMGVHTTYALAAGDIDNDGDLDLVEGSRGQANQVWLNPAASPPFVSIPQEESLNTTTSIALADIDGDGDLDLVEGNELQTNRVYFNDRSVFRDSFQNLAGNNTSKVLLGDINNDTVPDLIIANTTGTDNANLVFINNGAGVFTDSGQLLGSNDTQTAALADVDDDGDLDLVTGNTSSSTNKVWLNTAGVFTDSGQDLGTNDTQDMVMTDLDNDDDIDLVFTHVTGNETWINNINNLPGEKGQFTLLVGVTPGSGAVTVAAGDINGDNRPDLAFGFGFGRTAINNPDPLPDPDPGSNNYITCSLRDILEFCMDDQVNISGTPSSMALSDIDNDGDLDWIFATNGLNKIVFNDATGAAKGQRPFNTPARSLDLQGNNDTRSIAVGDIDNDGDIDIVEGNYGSTNTVKLNDF